mmetsp:Transcript_34116/g.79931  ORF Transcript_34116/g.79931 Transcript_34116/m.79931 type:complete len:376 (-) Transcript_34116:356-1483(-)
MDSPNSTTRYPGAGTDAAPPDAEQGAAQIQQTGSVEIATGNRVVEGVARKPKMHFSRKTKMLTLKIASAIALIMVATAGITVGVIYSQIYKDKAHFRIWDSNITTNIYIDGEDTIKHCNDTTCITVAELRALLGQQDFVTHLVDRMVLGDVEARLQQLEAELESSAEAAYAKERAQDEKKSVPVPLDGPDPTANATFLEQEFPLSESETASEDTNNGMRQLLAISGPSADAPTLGLKATQEFEKVVSAARAGDRRALSHLSVCRWVQSCRQVWYPCGCSWRGCRWCSRNVCSYRRVCSALPPPPPPPPPPPLQNTFTCFLCLARYARNACPAVAGVCRVCYGLPTPWTCSSCAAAVIGSCGGATAVCIAACGDPA